MRYAKDALLKTQKAADTLKSAASFIAEAMADFIRHMP